MARSKVGDLLVCMSGEDEETPTLGWVVDINPKPKVLYNKYTVQWFDDPDGEYHQYDNVEVYAKLREKYA